MHELGLLDEFLKRPHQELRELTGQVGSDSVTIADFRHVPTHCKFLALMPQWDFLDFLKQHAQHYPTFRLLMEAEVTELIEENGIVSGVRAQTPDGPIEVRAGLVVGADGRHSVVRERAGLNVIDLGSPMDVMWMRISRRPDDRGQAFGHIDRGRILVLLNRETYWQAAFVIPKGEGNRIRERGLEAFREEIARLEPFSAQPPAGAARLEGRQHTDGYGRPAVAVVSAGTLVHRRRRTCNVTHRRRRN
jgi:2-polyprenyl-6-methoxyphenol hydroxylase-like FAD-dependent oxidoreductase